MCSCFIRQEKAVIPISLKLGWANNFTDREGSENWEGRVFPVVTLASLAIVQTAACTALLTVRNNARRAHLIVKVPVRGIWRRRASDSVARRVKLALRVGGGGGGTGSVPIISAPAVSISTSLQSNMFGLRLQKPIDSPFCQMLVLCILCCQPVLRCSGLPCWESSTRIPDIPRRTDPSPRWTFEPFTSTCSE